jgi:peptide/nickel transport system substrate-binding protein
VDDSTVQVFTPEPFAPFVEFFGSVPILPKHVLQTAVTAKVFPAAYGVSSKPGRIVGCGPYRLKEFRPGKATLLERNPEYWVADQQGRRLPWFDEVLFTVGGSPASEPALFLGGKSDVCDTVHAQHYAQFKQASAGGRFQLLDLGVGADRDFFWFNQNTGTNSAGRPIVNPARLKWFRNKKFRQAVSCAVDRDRLVREVYAGRAQPAYGFIASENPRWNNPDIPRYAFDPARARSLLAEIGIQDRIGDGLMKDADGVPVEIRFYSNTGNPLREKAAALIAADLAKVGIKLIYLAMDYRALVERINVTYDYECVLMGLGGGGGDPASQMNVLRSSEDLHQWFPLQKTPSTDWEARIDSLMEAQMRTLNFAQRKKCFDEVQVIVAEELPMIYTVAPFAAAAIRADVGNVRPAVLSPHRLTWNLAELYFKKQ